MGKLVRSRLARQDLKEIWRCIAQDNPAAADSFLDRIGETCRLLGAPPGMGRKRDDLPGNLYPRKPAEHLGYPRCSRLTIYSGSGGTIAA